eukprot:c28840_g1_i1 orf=767-1825(-)
MESKVWSGLPEHLLPRILSYLPTESALRFRCVCKSWKKIMDSPQFLDLCSKHACCTPWLLMFKQQESRVCRVYDSFQNKWHTLSLGFLPRGVKDVAAASGGLLCFRFDISATLAVCNPLTKVWKQLPPMQFIQTSFAVGMVVDRNLRGYKVVVVGSHWDCFDMKTEIYDSRTNSWKRTGDLPPRTDLRREFAYCDGVLYFSTSEPDVVLAYSMEQEIWRKLQATLPVSLTWSRLVATQGLVFLVGGVGTQGISRSLGVWQLQKDRMQWLSVQKIPEIICRKFLAICYHTYEHICCVGHEDYICLFCSTSPKVLVYKISRHTWHWLPDCPLIPDKSNGGFSWFSFDPYLHAAA